MRGASARTSAARRPRRAQTPRARTKFEPRAHLGPRVRVHRGRHAAPRDQTTAGARKVLPQWRQEGARRRGGHIVARDAAHAECGGSLRQAAAAATARRGARREAWERHGARGAGAGRRAPRWQRAALAGVYSSSKNTNGGPVPPVASVTASATPARPRRTPLARGARQRSARQEEAQQGANRQAPVRHELYLMNIHEAG